MIFQGYVYTLLFAALVLFIAEIIYRFFTNEKVLSISRKIIHISIGFCFFIMNHYFIDKIHFIYVCFILFGVLIICTKFKLLKSLESHGTNKNYGTVYYAITLTTLAILSNIFPSVYPYFGVALCTIAFGDGFAGLLGSLFIKYNIKIYNNKTLIGYLANIIATTISVLIISQMFGIFDIWYLLLIVYLSSTLELIFSKGFDNLGIPFIIFIISMLYFNTQLIQNNHVFFIVIPLVALLVLKGKKLTLDGALLGLAFSILVTLLGGNLLFTLFALYFMLITVTELICKKIKPKEKAEKPRNIYQVFQNGFIPTAAVLVYFLTKDNLYLLVYILALSISLGDTIASTIGVLSKGNTYDIIKGKFVSPGESGGVSVLGSVSAFIYILIFAILFMLSSLITWYEVIYLSFLAFVGVFIDSLMGSKLQMKFYCHKCLSVVEEDMHCGEICECVSGYPFITNGMVNILSQGVTVLILILVYMAVRLCTVI